MKIVVEKGLMTFLSTGYWYRVTSMDVQDVHLAGSTTTINGITYEVHGRDLKVYTNHIYRYIKDPGNPGLLARSVDHLDPEIRQWLEECVPWGRWSTEKPRGERREGLLFSRKRDVLMFKLTWGGHD